MRSVVLVLLGAVLALVLVMDQSGPGVNEATAADESPAPLPAPKGCVECVDDGAADTCTGVVVGADGSIMCSFTNGQCVEVGYCWVSEDYPKPTIGVIH